MQKLTEFKVIFDLFTVCVYFLQQQNCKLYYIYLMIISEIQSEIGHCSCDSAKFKAPAEFSHHAILFFDIVLNVTLVGTPLLVSSSLLLPNLLRCRTQKLCSFSLATTCLLYLWVSLFMHSSFFHWSFLLPRGKIRIYLCTE